MKKPAISASQNKLILLYTLKTINIRLSDTQLLRIVDQGGWMNYFELKESLASLSENHMIDTHQSIHGIFYTINEIGLSTLAYFEKEIPYSIRSAIDEYGAQHKEALENESRLFAEYFSIGSDEYRVVLKILESDNTVFELDLIASSKTEAQRFVDGWYQKANEIYRHCHETLMLP